MNELMRPFTGQEPTVGYTTPIATEIGFSVTIPAGVGQIYTQDVLIDTTYDFVWQSKSARWSGTDWDVQITYPDGTRQQPAKVNGPLAFGQTPFEKELEPGYLVRGGNRIQFVFTNRTGGVITVDVVLNGQRVSPGRR